jgi:hypothetical protein
MQRLCRARDMAEREAFPVSTGNRYCTEDVKRSSR